jgi:hypothetical protein
VFEGLLGYLQGFGDVGLLVFLFVILCLDAMLVPTLPELFVMGFYAAHQPAPTFAWGVTLLAVVVAAELTGNGILYVVVRRTGLPRFIDKAMKKWVGFLVVQNERIILVNRVAPILPFVGAFVATMKWDPRRSFLYIFVGGAVKYAVLIALVGVLFAFFSGPTARNVTVALILLIIAVSFAQSHFAKRKHLGPVANRVAHFHEKSAVVVAPAPPAGDEQRSHGGGSPEQQQ